MNSDMIAELGRALVDHTHNGSAWMGQVTLLRHMENAHSYAVVGEVDATAEARVRMDHEIAHANAQQQAIDPGAAPVAPVADWPRSPIEPARPPTPDLHVTVLGLPGPQGSKTARAIYAGSGAARMFTGKVALVESSGKVKTWREAVAAGVALWIADFEDRATEWAPLDGPLYASMVFSLPRPKRSKFKDRPAGMPDLSKLLRATEDAITQARGWLDDARVVEYKRLAKVWAGSDDPDALPEPGAMIRIWRNYQ